MSVYVNYYINYEFSFKIDKKVVRKNQLLFVKCFNLFLFLLGKKEENLYVDRRTNEYNFFYVRSFVFECQKNLKVFSLLNKEQ